jgi:hypothetical protein
MDSDYTKGFEAGRDYAYAWVMEMINIHLDSNVNLTMQEILREVEHIAFEEYRLKQEADIKRLTGNA